MSALGLADYGSSDDEEDTSVKPADDLVKKEDIHENGKQPLDDTQLEQRQQQSDATVTMTATATTTTTTTLPLGPAQGPALGPALGPAPGPTTATISENMAHLPEDDDDDDQPPASPYTANRLLLRNLTMPPVANFDIPSSPPGSPPPATTAKFARFLDLKKKDIHFNERLDQSPALRNPALLAKLIDFAGISQQDQYASALPEALAVPIKFPEWAYADKLVKEHERIAKKREEDRARATREAIDFVPAKRAQEDDSMASKSSQGERSGGRGSRGNRPEAKRSRFDDRERRG